MYSNGIHKVARSHLYQNTSAYRHIRIIIDEKESALKGIRFVSVLISLFLKCAEKVIKRNKTTKNK